jgi:hypothetical protein
MKFGVKRLIAINSGKFELAEFDLEESVHLSAPNNRGKSTLVNALQFLYVDQIDRMHFGKRTAEDTRNHYFGQDPGYLVFECATPSGIQTMLVRGRGALQAGKFERFVYSGGYRREDYVEPDGIIRSFDNLKAQLADRELAEVSPSHLWEVLSGRIAPKGKALLPRLSILPVRSHDEYRSFREVFVGLLKLKNADARMLRRLIIACHARDIGERRIDVAALYRDMFDRATRSEEELRLIRSIAGLIDTGVAMRAEIRELGSVLGRQASVLWSQSGQHSEALTARLAAIEQSLAESGKLKAAKDDQRIAAHKEKWEADNQQKQAEDEKRKLEEAHRRWAAYSDEMIRTMREQVADLVREVARREEHIRQAGTFDHNAMQRDVADLVRQIKDNRRLVEDFDRTALAWLLKSGMAPAEVEKAFHVLHPETLKLIVGDHIEVRSPQELMERVRKFAARVQEGAYQDDAVRIRTDDLRGPDLEMMRNRESVAARLTLDEQRLHESQERLRVAEGLEPARQELKERKEELARRQAALDDYACYEHDWAARDELGATLAVAKTRVDQAAEKVRVLEADIRRLEQQLGGWRDEKHQLQECASALHPLLAEYRTVADRLGLPLEEATAAEQPQMQTPTLLEAIKDLGEQIKQWLDRARMIDRRRAELGRLEAQIGEESAHSRAQRIYFDDPELVWNELAEKREALSEQESSVQKQWDDLFTLLTANFEQIIIGLRNVETAVRALNRGIKSYQVSNLKAVELSVEKIRATYNAIEILASKGSIFQDADNIELAKRDLRNMIEGRQVIELENLFEVRIRVQENDGKWNDAKSLDDIGSTGTGITAKAMIFIQLVRAIVGNSEVGLHFYLDETGQLDDGNLKATTAMAVSRGMVPITAQPGVRMESLAHPKVTVYTLGMTIEGRFRIDSYQTYHARRAGHVSEKASHEPNRAEVLEEPA